MDATVPAPRFVCIGGALVDRKYSLNEPPCSGSSNPAVMRTTFGGVARNVCENLARLGATVSLAAAVGNDAAGRDLVAGLAALDVDVSWMPIMPGEATPEYAAILRGDTGEVVIAASAMGASEAAIGGAIDAILAAIPANACVFADANLTCGVLERVIAARRDQRGLLAVGPVSVLKSQRLPAELDGVGLIIMNRDEAVTYLGETGPAEDLAASLRRRGAAMAVVTHGAQGAAGADAAGVFHLPKARGCVVDVTGAGDSLTAALIWRLGQGEPLREALRWGVAAAGLTVASSASTHPDLSPAFLAEAVSRMSLS
jgi:pseudouridine kinase